MLIPSHRHTGRDLELWAEYERADLIHGNEVTPDGRRCDKLFNWAADAVHSFVAGGPCYLSVSWGKDSICAAHIVHCLFPDMPLVNLRCSNRNPECDAVRDAYLAAFPHANYHEIEVDYGRAHADLTCPDDLDIATDSLWYAGFQEANRRFGSRYITGIRADESGARKLRCKNWGTNTPNTCAPLAWWKTQDVFGYLAANNLPVHPSYAMLGGGRWKRNDLRTSEIGDTHGSQYGRAEWEREYYGDVLRRLAK